MSVNKVNKTTGELITLANGTRMWIGTKTAHDLAVQQGKMPNNCMVCITDDAPGDDAWKYSTEETKTGMTWIDGKPIYRKVIEKHITLAGNSWNSSGLDISEIDTLCNCVMLNSKLAFGGFYTAKVSNQLNVYCVSDANWNAHTVILEYTKTTD